MLNLAQLRNSDLQHRRPETPFAELVVPVLGRPTGEGDSMILLRLLLRASASALEYHLTAAEAAERGARLVAELSAEASVIEARLAQRAVELGQKIAGSGRKGRGRKAK